MPSKPVPYPGSVVWPKVDDALMAQVKKQIKQNITDSTPIIEAMTQYASKYQSRSKSPGKPWSPWKTQGYADSAIQQLLSYGVKWCAFKHDDAGGAVVQWRYNPAYKHKSEAVFD